MENKQEKALAFIANELHKAVSILASRCDGAYSEDGQGFNKYDTRWGHELAMENPDDWNQGRCRKVRKMLTKYRGQLERAGFILEDVPDLLGPESSRQVHFEPDFGGQFVLTLNYDDPQFSDVLRAVKAMERRFWKRERKAWIVPSDQAEHLAELVKEWKFKATEVASRELEREESLVQSQVQIVGRIEYQGQDCASIWFESFDRGVVADLKRTFPADKRIWRTNTPYRHWEINLDGVQADSGHPLYACLLAFAARWGLAIGDAMAGYFSGKEAHLYRQARALPKNEPVEHWSVESAMKLFE